MENKLSAENIIEEENIIEQNKLPNDLPENITEFLKNEEEIMRKNDMEFLKNKIFDRRTPEWARGWARNYERHSQRYNTGLSNWYPIYDDGCRNPELAAMKCPDEYYLNILESLGEAVYIWDTEMKLIYWNHTAENLFGYTYEEVLGEEVVKLLVHPKEHMLAYNIANHVLTGNTWKGVFPLYNKNADLLHVVATLTPFYNDKMEMMGSISVANDIKSYENVAVPLATLTENELVMSCTSILGRE